MDITVIIGGCVAALVIMSMVFQVVIQKRQKEQTIRNRELRKLNAVITNTEALLAEDVCLPLSFHLHACLQQRILGALKEKQTHLPDDVKLSQHIEDLQQQIKVITQTNTQDLTNFIVATSERKAIDQLKLLKKLRAVLSAEHKKGKISAPVFMEENARLEMMQLMINVENILKRIQEAMNSIQYGLAKQLALQAKAMVQDQQDAYSLSALEKINQHLNNAQEEMDVAFNTKKVKTAEDNDLDEIFAPKRKW